MNDNKKVKIMTWSKKCRWENSSIEKNEAGQAVSTSLACLS